MGLAEDGDVLRGVRTEEGGTKSGSSRWRTVLVVLLRLMSIIWIGKGLLAWATILGLLGDVQPPFESRLLSYQAIIVYFAVIDLVAAVGLWLTSTWGGVLWLLATISHMLLGFFFPRLLPISTWTAAAYLGLIAAYFLATWAAENEAS